MTFSSALMCLSIGYVLAKMNKQQEEDTPALMAFCALIDHFHVIIYRYSENVRGQKRYRTCPYVHAIHCAVRIST